MYHHKYQNSFSYYLNQSAHNKQINLCGSDNLRYTSQRLVGNDKPISRLAFQGMNTC